MTNRYIALRIVTARQSGSSSPKNSSFGGVFVMVKRGTWALFLVAVLYILAVRIPAAAEDKTGEIRGVLSDPMGAVIPSAKLVLSIQGASSQSATSGRNGSFSFTGVKPGKYSLEINAKGFAQTTVDEIELQPGQMLQKDVTLHLPVDQQQVEVTGEAAGVSTSPDSNASAIVIKGKDLDALSDNPDELQS